MSALPTSGAVLDFWIGPSVDDHLAAKRKNKLWFIKSDATDRQIETLFLPLVEALADGLAQTWAAQGPRQRLAAIIGLDQFSRNLFRGTPRSFARDPRALSLTEAGLDRGDDESLSEVERIFFYLPLEHSEDLANQDRSITLYEHLCVNCRTAFKPMCDDTLDYARKHRDVIRQFGRFPHRNKILGRTDTPDEQVFNAAPGTGF